MKKGMLKWEILKEKSERNKQSKVKMQLNAEKKYNELVETYPYLAAYKTYFSNVIENNSYITIMRQSLAESIPRLIIDTKPSVIAFVLSVDRTIISYYKKAKIHEDYNEVVVIMDKMINESLYPFAKVNRTTTKSIAEYSKTYYVWKTLNESP